MKNFQENKKWIVTIMALFFAFAFSMSAKQGTLASLQFDSNSSHPYLDTMDMDSYMDSYEGSSEEYEYKDYEEYDDYDDYDYDMYQPSEDTTTYPVVDPSTDYNEYEDYDYEDEYEDYDTYQPSEETTTQPIVDPATNGDYSSEGYIEEYEYDVEEAASPASDPIDDVFDDDEPVPAIEDEDNSYYLEKILQKLLRMFGA